MATDLAAKITIGFDGSRAEHGLANLKGQFNDLTKETAKAASGAGGAIGALSGGFSALGSVLTAVAPEIGIPLQVLNFGLQAGLNAVNAVAHGVGSVLGGAFHAVSGVIESVVHTVGEGLSHAFEIAEGWAKRFLDTAKWGALAVVGLTEEIARRSIGASIESEVAFARLKTSLHGNVAAAQELKDWLERVFEPHAPFEISSIIDATTTLNLFGLQAQKWLPLVGNMAGSMGRNITDAAQAVSMGMMGNERMLREYGIAARDLIAHGADAAPGGHGVSVGGPEGEAHMAAALSSLLAEKFGGGMASYMQTQAGIWTNLLTVWHKIKVAIGDQLLPTIKELTQGLIGMGNELLENGTFARAAQWFGEQVRGIIEHVRGLLTPERINSLAIGIDRAFAWIVNAGRWAWGILTQVFSALFTGGYVPRILGSILSIGNAIYTGLIQPLAGATAGGVSGFFERIARGFELVGRIITAGNLMLVVQWLQYVGNMVKWLANTVTLNLGNVATTAKYAFDMILYGIGQLYTKLPDIIDWFGGLAAEIGHVASLLLMAAAGAAAFTAPWMVGKLLVAGKDAYTMGENTARSAYKTSAGMRDQQEIDFWRGMGTGQAPWYMRSEPVAPNLDWQTAGPMPTAPTGQFSMGGTPAPYSSGSDLRTTNRLLEELVEAARRNGFLPLAPYGAPR